MKPDDHRRKWDREEYEKLALERLREEISAEENDKLNLPVHRALLKRREYKVDLESKLGKSVVITKNTPASQSGGYVEKFQLFKLFC
jgi:U4/U6.U5 tri-snRNP component SNU23